MRTAESSLRRLIRETLLSEDLSGFKSRTKGHDYRSPKWDPTFELEPANPERSPKMLAKSVKRSWNAEADHGFMDSLVKVHWFKDKAWKHSFPQLMTISGRNEISAMGYLPGTRASSDWGRMGLLLKGRVTLAANSMNAIMSGFNSDIPDDASKKYRASGIPRRPTFFSEVPETEFDFSSSDYILDRESFDESMQGNNELILDNWKPIGVVVQDAELDDIVQSATVAGKKGGKRDQFDFVHETLLDQVKAALEWDLPVYGSDIRALPDEGIQKALRGEYGKE
jgi:hypothetical protein